MQRAALLVVVAVGVLGGSLAQQPPPNPRPPKPAAAQTAVTDPCERYRSLLDVRIFATGDRLQPSAELLLTDPQGRRVGMDPAARKSYSEIPNAAYEFEGIDDDETGEPGPNTGVIWVGCGPPAGEYKLEVIGTDDAPYEVDVLAYDERTNSASAHVGPVKIVKGERHGYRIVWGKEPSASVAVRRVQPPAVRK